MKVAERANEIGGYFGLELGRGAGGPHDGALALNTARNGLLYVLSQRKPPKIYLPCFICNSVIDTLESAGVQYAFYNIDERLEMAEPLELYAGDRVLVVNYFGLKSAYCRELFDRYGKALFVDNTQAFYAEPLAGCDTIYSPRKFFGVSDGGYLYTSIRSSDSLEQDVSWTAAQHLVGRVDTSAAQFYEEFRESEKRLRARPVRTMSRLSEAILGSLDYDLIRKTRERNFLFVHNALAHANRMSIRLTDLCGPMVYPFWTQDLGLRQELLKKRIYVATYWAEVLENRYSSQIEKDLADGLLPLPIDQRYGLNDMQTIIDSVLSLTVRRPE